MLADTWEAERNLHSAGTAAGGTQLPGGCPKVRVDELRGHMVTGIHQAVLNSVLQSGADQAMTEAVGIDGGIGAWGWNSGQVSRREVKPSRRESSMASHTGGTRDSCQAVSPRRLWR